MIENVNAANAAREGKLHAVSGNLRRMTASSRSGQSYSDGEKLIVLGGLLPDVLTIDNAGAEATQYLAYDCAGGQNISYKGLLGQRVILPTLPEGTQASGLTAKVNGEVVETYLVDRSLFQPRTAGKLSFSTRVTAAGDSIEVLDSDTALTVEVRDVYVSVLPDGVKRHPSGQYYCRLAKGYATFKVS